MNTPYTIEKSFNKFLQENYSFNISEAPHPLFADYLTYEKIDLVLLGDFEMYRIKYVDVSSFDVYANVKNFKHIWAFRAKRSDNKYIFLDLHELLNMVNAKLSDVDANFMSVSELRIEIALLLGGQICPQVAINHNLSEHSVHEQSVRHFPFLLHYVEKICTDDYVIDESSIFPFKNNDVVDTFRLLDLYSSSYSLLVYDFIIFMNTSNNLHVFLNNRTEVVWLNIL
ncbi:MAG: hypothetical protein P5702_24170 [Limnospira sp. PMC 1291.21]|uniref:hypothetical protein n=1 Tax=unclassified Limnospira TaxID=2642885 RepID=UPI0028E0E0CD|nr:MULTISPECIES: hypothetical protein [unclassified Limnospira]MDT9231664.1 hypothetical protein [Limnospira sp. PMC 1242.20]MDT9308332.1 hypothetical protein [Limnospira sp. PMC 1291.21]MDT9313464.1 hypothetical protein [Limnospira sp. Paracas R14]